MTYNFPLFRSYGHIWCNNRFLKAPAEIIGNFLFQIHFSPQWRGTFVKIFKHRVRVKI